MENKLASQPEKASSSAGDLIASGRTSRKQGNHAQALQHFLAAAASAPANPVPLYEIGLALCDLNRPSEAEPRFRAALGLAPNTIPALTGLAKLAMQRNDPGSALQFLQQASAADPDNVPVKIQLGRALQQLGRLDEAEALFKSALEVVPGNVACLEGLGDVANGRRDEVAALGWYEKAFAIDPRSPSIQYKVARTLHGFGRNDEAEKRYLALLNQAPEHNGALFGLTALARSSGKPEVALERLRAATGKGNFKLPIHHRIADLLRDLQRFDEAAVVYRTIVREVPGDVTALVGLGTLERKRENYEASLAHFQSAYSKAPDDPKIGIHVVNGLRGVLRFEEAGVLLSKLESSTKVDAAEKHVWRFEHLCLTMQLKEAEKYVQAWQGHRNVPRAAVVRTAQLYAALGRWSDIFDFFRERVVEDEWSDAYNYMMEPLSRAARGTGRYSEACEILDRLPARPVTDAIRDTRDQIIEEMRLIAFLDPRIAQTSIQVDNTIQNPMRIRRADLFSQVVGMPAWTQPPVRIYMCTDANYLLGASVCMFSLLKYNRASLGNCQLTVYCDDEVVELGEAVFTQLGSAFGVIIDVRASSSLLPKDLEFRTDWGVFNPGRSLSQAAYYRIYAARQMVQEEIPGRALYIDSDTCVFDGVRHFFDYDLAGQPLGACLDDKQKPRIRSASTLLEVDKVL